MCLILEKGSKRLKADEDIVVYKVLKIIHNSYHTYYREFPVEIGKTYKSKLIRDKSDNGYKYGCVEAGLHSFIIKPSFKYCNIAKCVIPKGSYYYKGSFVSESDSYASNKLTYVEIC